MFKAIQKGFNNIGKNIEGAVRGTIVGNASTGGDAWNIGGGGGESTETTTQQNLPDWAIPSAMGTLALGDYYTMNPYYRPSTLNRDYSGIRGYNAQGQPNSQVGEFGLSPMPAFPNPQGREFGLSPMPAQRPLQSPLNGNQPTGRGEGRRVADNTATVTKTTIDPNDSSNLGNLTPFPAFDRQRFAAPGQNTLRGEGILAGRYDQRFGLGGTDPFADAKTAVDEAANYDSTFTGTTGIDPITGEKRIGSKAGNYQTGLKSAEDPGVFSGKTYTSNLDTKFSNPNAGMQNVNAGLQNVNAGVQNVNAGMRSQQFGNANEELLGAQDYTTGRSFQDRVQDFMNPYTDQVVNRSLQDINRARQMADMSTMGGAAKSGAFGGSREALMRAENTRNALDQAGRTSGQLRSAGFNTAANLAQQEELQRLGLTASDRQNLRGYQSAGNLQGQSLTAADLQNVRGLQSQGALTAQGLRSQGALAAQALQSQGALAAQGLQSQGALAALNANANLYGQGLSLGAGLDQAALQANAGLLSDAMKLDAADLQQRRNIASSEAQFAENANRGAGALNLQGGTALGNLAQVGIADERQRIADMLAAGQAVDTRNQQDLDFIYNEFQRELAYPGQQIDLRNAAISPATGSIVTTTQPRYSQNPLVSAIGAGVGAYGMTKNPYLALLAGGASLLSEEDQ